MSNSRTSTLLTPKQLDKLKLVDPRDGKTISGKPVYKNPSNKTYVVMNDDRTFSTVITQNKYNSSEASFNYDDLTLETWHETLVQNIRNREIVKKLCIKYPEFFEYFCGCSINIGTETNPIWREITPEQVITNFKTALASQNQLFIDAVVSRNQEKRIKYIQNLYSIEKQAQLLYQCLSNFEIRNEVNPRIRHYLSSTVKDTRVLDECIKLIKTKKSKYNDLKIRFLEHHKAYLDPLNHSRKFIDQNHEFLSSLEFHLPTEPTIEKNLLDTDHDALPATTQNATEKSIFDELDLSVLPPVSDSNTHEEKTLFSGSTMMLDTKLVAPGVNSSYSFFSTHPKPMLPKIQDNPYSPNLNAELLSHQQWSNDFRTALSTSSSAEIKAMWDSARENSKDYFLGKKLIFSKNETVNQHEIPIKECFINFKTILTTKNTGLLDLIWNESSNKLGRHINQLSVGESASLLWAVIQTSTDEITDFVRSYITQIKNRFVIKKALNSIPFLEPNYAQQLHVLLSEQMDKSLCSKRKPEAELIDGSIKFRM